MADGLDGMRDVGADDYQHVAYQIGEQFVGLGREFCAGHGAREVHYSITWFSVCESRPHRRRLSRIVLHAGVCAGLRPHGLAVAQAFGSAKHTWVETTRLKLITLRGRGSRFLHTRLRVRHDGHCDVGLKALRCGPEVFRR